MIVSLMFLMPFVCMLVCLVIFAVRRGSSAGKAMMFLLLPIMMVLGFMMFWAQPRRVVTTEVAEFELPNTFGRVETVWREGVEQELKADVYLSKSAAIVGLAREIEKTVTTVMDQESQPGQIRMLEGGVEGHLLGELKQILSESFPGVVSIVPADTAETEQDVTVSLTYADLSESRVTVNKLGQSDIVKIQHVVGPSMMSGRLEAAVQTANGKDVYSVKFSEKTWLTDTTEFMAANPEQNWQVVRSADACISEQQAMAQAIEKACEMLKMNVGMANVPVTEQDLIEGGFISDRFTQSFFGSAGRIWRAAVLVDVSPERLGNLAGRKTVMVKRYRSGLLNQILTLAGVIALICLVYFFLNAATKGYYSWAMRFAAAVLILAGIFIVLMLS